MKRKSTVWLAIACVLALLVTIPGTALAGGDHGGASKDKAAGGSGHGHRYGSFTDVGENHWAYHDITMMQVKSVFGGYGNGKFGPQDAVSCLQLAILAVRVTGAEEAAKAMTPEAVDAALSGGWLDPADPVPTWPGARECLAYAYEHGYLNGFINQERVMFRPSSPATRLEVIVTLLDAVGLTAAAQAMADAPITAPDAGTVPAWAHGYVALAKDTGLLRGDNTGALRLQSHVTRAEMAALLCRIGGQAPTDKIDHRTIKATLLSVTTGDSPSITVKVKGEEFNDYIGEDDEQETGTQPAETQTGLGNVEHNYGDNEIVTTTLPVSPDASIFRDGAVATLDQLVPGDRLQLRLDADGLVVFLDARGPKAGTGEGDGALEVAGPFVSAEYDASGVMTSITIVVASVETDEDQQGQPGQGLVVGETATFAVSPDVVVKGGGDSDSGAAAAATFTEGQYLELKLKQDTVVVIDAGDQDENQDENDEDQAD